MTALPTLLAELRRQVQAAPENASMTTIKVGAVEVRALLAHIEALEVDARRYRHIRNRNNSLESAQYDRQLVNGPSCYHRVEGIRELKYGDELDFAVDSAIAALAEQGEPK